MTTDTIEYINQALLENKKVLVEGRSVPVFSLHVCVFLYVVMRVFREFIFLCRHCSAYPAAL